jgi:hypothetical protein
LEAAELLLAEEMRAAGILTAEVEWLRERSGIGAFRSD